MLKNTNKWLSNFVSSILISSSLIGCTTSAPTIGSDDFAMTAYGSAAEPVDCADCDLKEAIEAKKGNIRSKEALLRADKQTVQAMKDYNEALTGSIKDYDKKIATLKNSGMQAFKFALEGALAVLEIESLVGLAKNVKCLKPTAKAPILVNGVKVAGPDILKFGLALKDPKKVKMFVAKATIKGTAAAANDPDQTWTEMAIGYIPLTSAMKLPQRWDEWINAGDLIAVLNDAKAKVEEQIKANEASIVELEKVIPLTEARIKTLKEELQKLEDELAAKGGQCVADTDDTNDTDDTAVEPTPTTATYDSRQYYYASYSGSGAVATEEPTPTDGDGSGSAYTPPPPPPSDGEGSGSAYPPPTTCESEYDFVDYDDQGEGCGGGEPVDTSSGTLPDAGSDNTTFPWGQTF